MVIFINCSASNRKVAGILIFDIFVFFGECSRDAVRLSICDVQVSRISRTRSTSHRHLCVILVNQVHRKLSTFKRAIPLLKVRFCPFRFLRFKINWAPCPIALLCFALLCLTLRCHPFLLGQRKPLLVDLHFNAIPPLLYHC